MPTFDYKCEKCGTKYEVFHKVRENKDIVICPSCGAKEHKKLIGAANIGSISSKSYVSEAPPVAPSCATGACGLN